MTPQHYRSTTARPGMRAARRAGESQKRSEQESGFALVAVIVTALIASVASFGALLLAMSHAQTGAAQVDRLRAQYAAEAGLVWAQQHLWADPDYPNCTVPGATMIRNNEKIGLARPVTITVTNCGAGNAHRLQAKVSY